jgi:hypothetical protein
LGLLYYETGKYKKAKETVTLLSEKNPNYDKKDDIKSLLEKIQKQ